MFSFNILAFLAAVRPLRRLSLCTIQDSCRWVIYWKQFFCDLCNWIIEITRDFDKWEFFCGGGSAYSVIELLIEYNVLCFRCAICYFYSVYSIKEFYYK